MEERVRVGEGWGEGEGVGKSLFHADFFFLKYI